MSYGNKGRIRGMAVSVVLLGLLSFVASSQGAPQGSQGVRSSVPENTGAIDSELGIMARVMEDSITQAGLKDWQAPVAGLGVFEPLTKAQYIPTVGAIFTLGVNFCITEPEAPKPEPEPTKAPEDLWEKNSDASALALPDKETLGSALTKRIRSVQIEVTDAVKPGNAKYDAEKVRMLRQSVIVALAKYGCRIEHVKESERILVVVEAPKSTPLQLGEVTLPESVRVWLKPGSERKGASVDSLLIAIKKADVKSSVTPEQLQGKVEEIHY
jgi:hypothetical protein